MKPSAKAATHVLILLTISAYLFFWRIGDRNLFGTEAHRALPAQAMLDTHDWLVPRLNGEPFLTKPPLTYWLIGISSLPREKVTETSARLPSAVCATLLIVAIYWLIATTVNSQAAFLSALVALSTFLFFEKAIQAEIDMGLAAWVGLSLVFFYKGIQESKRNLSYLLAAYTFLAAAFLSKGPPAMVFFAATVIPFLLWERRIRMLWSRPNLFGFCLFLFICFLWIASIIFAVGQDKLLGNLQNEFIHRVGASTSFHPGDILFYPIGIAAGFAPWSLFLPFAFLPSYYKSLDEPRRSLQRFLYCGIIFNLILFSTIAGKANRYLLPVYPLMAILTGLFWHDLLTHRLSERLQHILHRIMEILFGTSAIGILVFILVQRFFHIPDFPTSLHILSGLAAASFIGFFFIRISNYKGAFASLILFFLIVKLMYVFDFTPYKNSKHSILPIAAGINKATEYGKIIYTVTFSKPHIFFYFRDRVIKLSDMSLLYQKAAEPAYFLLTDEEMKQTVEAGLAPNAIYQFIFRNQRLSLVSFETTAKGTMGPDK